MLVVHQPPNTAWPQASPRPTPWVPCVSSVQSLCGCFGASAPMMSSPLPLHLWWGKLSRHCAPTFAYTWQIVIMCHHTKTCLLSQYIKKHKKIYNSKNLKMGFGIHYLCHHMPLLVVEACPGLPRNLFPHRDNHRWQLSATATMEISQLGKAYTPYLLPVCT